MKDLIPIERITSKIYRIRNQKVLLDQDIADLYGVETRHLVQAVKRNINRFPDDFMFQLSKEEFKILRSQIVTSSWGGRRYPPYVFTEQGIAMLSSVLQSERAVNVNIAIMRAFVQLRKLSYNYTELHKKIETIERKYDKQFRVVFEAIKQLIETPKKPKGKFGFRKE
ncbi:MAG: ORF6N domain-containing protein [Calditrichia bacterium]|nr:ORF6N domain-containing protein [Calditrichia bacterium]